MKQYIFYENCEIFLIIFNHENDDFPSGTKINDCYGRLTKISKN